MIRLIFLRAATLLALLFVPAPALHAQETEYEGAAALGLELRRLGTVKRVLMIGAHPDDESTQILSTLALGQGADVAYLALTRGEGGQNGIGPELEEGLGLLRSEELLAARRLDGATQYFTRAYDFGFSKNAEEAFRHWPREALLEDVVAAIRHFRPDVVLSIFSGTPRDGHGHHQAAGILAREAFAAAADPERFSRLSAAGLAPFAPKRLYLALWGGNDSAEVGLSTGSLDPLLGQSHYQVAMASRSRHRSQDMGRPLIPGPQENGLELVATRGDSSSASGSLFAGLDTTLTAIAAEHGLDGGSMAALREFEEIVPRIRKGYNPFDPAALVAPLAQALSALRRAEGGLAEGGARAAVRGEIDDAEAALWRASLLELDGIAADETLVPGQLVEVTVSLWNGGEAPVALRRLEPMLPPDWTAEALDPLPSALGPGALLERRFRVGVPREASLSRPYFLRHEREGDLYSWDEGRLVGVPFEAEAVRVVAEVEVAKVPVTEDAEATFREVDRRQGEIRRPVRVVPAVSVLVSPGSAVVPLADDGAEPRPLEIIARVRSEAPAGVSGTLALRPPPRWHVEPERVELRLAEEGAERSVRFLARPPADLVADETALDAVFTDESAVEYSRGFVLVDYPHVRPRPLYREAAVRVRAFGIEVPQGLRVAYVPGAGDDAPQALSQLGVAVTVLGAGELASADLSAFDAVLVGIRAYEVNQALIAHNRRLLDYARGGGTVVVQYNKYEYTEEGIAPFPVAMSRPHDRVTDETAEVRLLRPDHQALVWPNRIGADDFAGWVQERGLYFLSEWDERFTPLLEMADPGESPLRGSLLVAPLGEGSYVYTGLALFRQLPAGVPGAYRLLVNLLSLGRSP